MTKSASTPKSPPPVPMPEDPAVEEARIKALEAARKAKGRVATLIAPDAQTLGAAPTQRKTLLGS